MNTSDTKTLSIKTKDMFAIIYSYDNQYFIQTISAKEFIEAEYYTHEYDDRQIRYRNLDKHKGHILTVMCESFEGCPAFVYDYSEGLKVEFKCLSPELFELIKGRYYDTRKTR